MSEEDRDLDASTLPALRHGYALRVPRTDMIEIVAPDGALCLSIRLDLSGPVVEVRAASLRVATEGDLVLDCERFEVNAREDICLISAGGIAQDAHGDVVIRADGEIATEAAGQQHRARRGNVDIRANDDVMLDGERVMLNGPRAFAVPPVDLASRQLRAPTPAPTGPAPQAAIAVGDAEPLGDAEPTTEPT